MLYRVIRKRTGSLQPGGSFWQKEVLYCGESRQDARRIYHGSCPLDSQTPSYGNPCTETVIETIEDAETDDFADDIVNRA